VSRPPRLCACGRIVAYGIRCACQREQDHARKARHDQRRPNARQRGYDRQWEEAAKAFLQLPGHDRCECGRPATLVRHIKSIRRYPHLRMVRSNWRPGCARCNAKDAARERQQ
jgi:5-methylcytosine-specific restriction endonuclease McrA